MTDPTPDIGALTDELRGTAEYLEGERIGADDVVMLRAAADALEDSAAKVERLTKALQDARTETLRIASETGDQMAHIQLLRMERTIITAALAAATEESSLRADLPFPKSAREHDEELRRIQQWEATRPEESSDD